jgi:hypothetical protein
MLSPIAIAVVIAGVSVAPSTTVHGTPPQIAAVESWFSAINHKNLKAAQDDFLLADRGQMDWSNGKTSGWPTFSDIRCRLLSTSHLRADASCTFRESAAPDVGKPDTFWGMALVLCGKRWLITNYGQG